MKIALAQLDATVGDLRNNGARILDFYRRGTAAGANLVMTPEMAITGYPPRDLLAKQRFVDDNLHVLEELTAHVGPTALLVGYVDFNTKRPGRDYWNAVALIQNGKIIARRQKMLLPTYDVFDEDRYFQPAESNAVVEFADRRLGVTVCEDIWTEDYLPARLYERSPVFDLMRGDKRAQFLLNMSASPYHLGKERARYDMLRAVAQRHGVPVVYCNLVGGNDELVFDGNSLAFGGAGQLIATGAAFAEDLILVDLDSGVALQPEPVKLVAALHDALVLGLRDYTRKCGFKSVVLGLSGGIDSAVTACLAVTALGAENVMGVSMPSQFSSQGSIDDARDLARNLGIRWETIAIQNIFEQFKVTLQPVFKGLPEDTTEENIQARIRGTTLMALSNKFGHMLLTTGNKSELAVGYCTLYGDMNGGLGVIADVPKTMVYELARYINETERGKTERQGFRFRNRRSQKRRPPNCGPIKRTRIRFRPTTFSTRLSNATSKKQNRRSRS
jgi:NAD+ synthase (glutamine-hydrolysing)